MINNGMSPEQMLQALYSSVQSLSGAQSNLAGGGDLGNAAAAAGAEGGNPMTLAASKQVAPMMDAVSAGAVFENFKTMRDTVLIEILKNKTTAAKQAAMGWK